MTDPMQNSDAFAAVTGLIALITDPKACAKRLADLQQQLAAAAKAQAKLDADREAYERKVAADKAELAAREQKIAERLYKAMRLEREPPRDPVDPDDRFPHDPNFGPGTRSHTGLARDAGRG
jgi:septal ring factor EnvC (AmiA/AmiB activator)